MGLKYPVCTYVYIYTHIHIYIYIFYLFVKCMCVPHEKSLYCPSPLLFSSPAKLIPVREVLCEHPGLDVVSLRDLTIALA